MTGNPESMALAGVLAYLVGRAHAARRHRRTMAVLTQDALDVVASERQQALMTTDAYRHAALAAIVEVRAAYEVATRAVAAVSVWRSLADTDDADAFLHAELAELRQRAEAGIEQADVLRGWLS